VLVPTLVEYIWKLGVGFHLLKIVAVFGIYWELFGNQELEFNYSRQESVPKFE